MDIREFNFSVQSTIDRIIFLRICKAMSIERYGWLQASNPADRSRHDRIVCLVESMLSLHKQLAETRTGHEKTAIQRRIDSTDKRIDHLIYELYSLTEEKINCRGGSEISI